jgi:hypothetical protein
LRPELSRREFLAAAVVPVVLRRTPQGSPLPPYGNGTIQSGIRSRSVANVNGLTVHMLEAGFERPARPAVLLLHGFPELAYSWRKVMLPPAAAGYHVIAPDMRGFGRTTGWDNPYECGSGSIPNPGHGARFDCARSCAWPSQCRDDCRARCRCADRIVGCSHPARRLSLAHHYEFAV